MSAITLPVSTGSIWYNTTSGTSTSTATNISITNCTFVSSGGTAIYIDADSSFVHDNGNIQVHNGSVLELPDGTIINVDDNGNFEILDDDAKIIYKANRVREFNRYMNASDLLEAFIEDLGKANVKQGEVLSVPIEMFINWIIHKSAEQDGDSIPQDIPSLEDNKYKHPQCKCCGRFIKKSLFAKGLHFCDGDHYQKYIEKSL